MHYRHKRLQKGASDHIVISATNQSNRLAQKWKENKLGGRKE
jgi:hypothetical protein